MSTRRFRFPLMFAAVGLAAFVVTSCGKKQPPEKLHLLVWRENRAARVAYDWRWLAPDRLDGFVLRRCSRRHQCGEPGVFGLQAGKLAEQLFTREIFPVRAGPLAFVHRFNGRNRI